MFWNYISLLLKNPNCYFTALSTTLYVCCYLQATFKFITASKDIKKFKSKSDVGMQVSLVGLENGGAIKVSLVSHPSLGSRSVPWFSKGLSMPSPS